MLSNRTQHSIPSHSNPFPTLAGVKGWSVLPLLLLFGNTTAERFEQVLATCDHNHVTLCTHRLELDGRPEVEHSLGALLNGPLQG